MLREKFLLYAAIILAAALESPAVAQNATATRRPDDLARPPLPSFEFSDQVSLESGREPTSTEFVLTQTAGGPWAEETVPGLSDGYVTTTSVRNNCSCCPRHHRETRRRGLRLWKPHFHKSHGRGNRATCEPPLGFFMYAAVNTQIANGEAARMVLYHYDFIQANDQLNARGAARLNKIAQLLPQNPFPVVIQQSLENRVLDEARRRTVLRELAKKPFPVAEQRVVIGEPPARGLDGVDAEAIHENLLEQMKSGSTIGLDASQL